MLPEPSFIDRDPVKITAELISTYEQKTGRTLQPAQVERVLIDLIAYRESLLRIAVQEAAKQNLVNYAVFPMLDYLGELVGVTRLAAQPARTTLRFILVGVQTFSVLIPAGTRVATKDGQQYFTTDLALTILAGQTTGLVSAKAEIAGVAGNGYLAGDVNTLVGLVAYVSGVANTTLTAGGADAETDENLRTRIKSAPERFSVAGTKGAYQYWAKTAHQDVIDVAVSSPMPGTVNVYPLTTTGNPTAAILDLVTTTLNADKVRPLTDLVAVLSPTQINFSITANVTLYAFADSATVTTQINSALNTYTAGLKAKLGGDVVLSQIIALINGVYGVYKTTLVAPLADIVIADNEWANCTATTVNIVGSVNG